MNIFSWNFFWGVLLILWGGSLILRTFNIFLPLAKIFIALMIILFGIKLLLGNRCPILCKIQNKAKVNTVTNLNGSGEYTLVFASGTVDLTSIKADSKDLEINVIFGSAEVILPSNLYFDIDATAVFGKNLVPKGINRNALDSRSIHLESNAIFGSIIYRIEDIIASPIEDEVPNGEF